MEKLEFLIAHVEDLRNKLETQEKANKALKKEVKHIADEQQKWKGAVAVLKSERNRDEQSKLNKNVIISGLPKIKENNEENLNTVFRISEKLEVNLTKEVVTCKRIGKGANSQLKVMFENEELKKKFMEAKKKTNLNSSQPGFVEKHPIYINHELTSENQLLFKNTRDFKRQYNYKFAWISQGRILLKKTETGRNIEINTEEDLNKLIQKN
ncbi:uncharacterized protein LOC123673446 [Harmonia axyridis]|uniref:uncharacterized protein LOC123673446 n=1 Tax=Harmonia axyridis TaxID=115357 RepID=UPI001E27917D|nr:uncharacterized protein LOC123673446 [Harmonia axyridis]